MVPDVFLVSTQRWECFTPTQQQLVREAARASYDRMNVLWEAFDADMRTRVQGMGVTLDLSGQGPFIARAEALKKEFAGDAELVRLIGQIAGS